MMRTWGKTVLTLGTVALCACACGKSQEAEDTRAARPSIATADTASTPIAARSTTESAEPPAPIPGGGEASAPQTTSPGAKGAGTAPAAEPSDAVAPPPPSASSTPTPTPVESTAPPAASPAPPSASTDVVDSGGEVAVKPTKPGLTRIGAPKCQPCHRIQFTSWAETAHAKRTPPLDCEACHGPGSEYKTMTIMKDPAQARAAGLVMPAKEFCVTCHRGAWSDALLTRVHAHKPATP